MPPPLATELVVVCCHAVFRGRDPRIEEHWALQPFQKSSGEKPGEHLTFLQHIQVAVSYRDRSGNSPQIVFSGGRTRHDFPDLSEAKSYLHAALRLDWLHEDDVLLDELATDSYQNVLFSIILFRRHHGHYPSAVNIVTHAFKRERFVDIHREAIRWPPEQFTVLGVPLPPEVPAAELEAICAAEKRNGYDLWKLDPYGMGRSLSEKRRLRRWDGTSLELLARGLEQSVRDLLFYRGGKDGTETFTDPLPWTAAQ